MTKLEQARQMLRFCNAVDEKWAEKRDIWIEDAHELCCGYCGPECPTVAALQWIFPELENYTEKATEAEWLEYKEKQC